MFCRHAHLFPALKYAVVELTVGVHFPRQDRVFHRSVFKLQSRASLFGKFPSKLFFFRSGCQEGRLDPGHHTSDLFVQAPAGFVDLGFELSQARIAEIIFGREIGIIAFQRATIAPLGFE